MGGFPCFFPFQGSPCFFESFSFWPRDFRARILDGRNGARVIAESLARVIAAIRIASVRWRSYLPPKHRTLSSQTLRLLCCDSDRAIGVHSFNIRSTRIRGRHGGVEKAEGGKPHEGHATQRRFWTPPSSGTFSTPSRLSALFFLYENPRLMQTRSSFGRVQTFSGGCVVWYVSPYVLHPPVSWPKWNCGMACES